MPEEELLAEVYRGRILSLAPLDDKGFLVPDARVWAASLYLALWLALEPSTKAIAAALSVLPVA